MQSFEDCEKILKTFFVPSPSEYHPDIKRGPDAAHLKLVTAIYYQYVIHLHSTPGLTRECFVVPFP